MIDYETLETCFIALGYRIGKCREMTSYSSGNKKMDDYWRGELERAEKAKAEIRSALGWDRREGGQ